MTWKIFDASFWTHFFKSSHRGLRSIAKPARIAIAAIRGFSADDCYGKASALTFYSLLSIVPVLAVAFGIAKGFGFEKTLQNELKQRFFEQKEITDKLIEFAYNALQNSQSGLIAGVGLLVLFWSVLQLLSTIEYSFNDIWKVRNPRPIIRRFSDYLAMMLVGPVFFAASSSLSVFVVAYITNLSETDGTFKTLSPYILFSFHIFPLILVWLLFTALYYIMPNTHVPIRYALIGGFLAGTAFQIVQWTYIKFQIGLSSYGAIYGSFAAIPLFLIWLNLSWLITLMGAEIAHHAESNSIQEYLAKASRQRKADARILGLIIMQQCIQAFIKGNPPPTLNHFAQRTGVPIVIVRNYVHSLINEGLLVEVNWKDSSSGYYQPGRDINSITVKAVCDALDTARHEFHLVVYDQEVESYEKVLEDFDNVISKDKNNTPLSEVIKHTV